MDEAFSAHESQSDEQCQGSSESVGSTNLLPIPTEPLTEPCSQASNAAKTGLLSLPDEILGLVLTCLSALSPACLTSWPYSVYLDLDNLFLYESGRNPLGWIVVTHVCRRLRIIALGLPTLWTLVIVTGRPTRWLRDVLQRSRDQPLSLHFPNSRLGRGEEAECLAILDKARVLSRIQHVTFGTIKCWMPFIQGLLTNNAPQLETIKLGPRDVSVHVDVYVLPQSLFGYEPNRAPRLRSLKLVQCDFSWSTLQHFSSLTTLSISRPYIPPGDEYNVLSPDDTGSYHRTRRLADALGHSMDEVVACLRALPHLTDLVLENALPMWEPSETNVKHPQILLPELRSLVLKQRRLHPISFILTLLDAPQLFNCELQCWTIARPVGPGLQAHSAPLVEFLSRFASNLPFPITSVRVKSGNPDISLYAWCALGNRSWLCLDVTFSMAIVPRHSDDWPNRHACLEPVIAALPLGRLQQLDISDELTPTEEASHYAVDFPFWTRIYEMCGSAKYVLASGLALVPLLPLLTHRNLPTWEFDVPPPEPRMPLFPNLKSLEIEVDKLSDQTAGVVLCLASVHGRENQSAAIPAFIKAVGDCLKSRLEKLPKLGHLSAKLSMWDYDGTGIDVERFQKMFLEEAGSVAEEVKPLDVQVDVYVRWHYKNAQGQYYLY